MNRVLTCVAAVAAALLLLVPAALAAVSPGQLAKAIDQINHAQLGYLKAHTVCRPIRGGKSVCTVNLGAKNTTITIVPFDAQCFRATFWKTGAIVHIKTASVVQVPCSTAPAPNA